MGALTAASAVRVWGANDKVNLGIVGLGGRGSGHLNTYTSLSEAQVVAVCDVNQAARERAQAKEESGESPGVRRYAADVCRPRGRGGLYRNSEPLHALSAIWAMKEGKDVYGEKPASYNIYEGMRMIQVQRETKRLMQVGSQHRSWP
jgi:predicted dehydrogenase